MSEAPKNIQEFNTIAGLIFAQLYVAFPVLVDIDRNSIAQAMGAAGGDWTHKLPSGRSVSEMLAYTISWLTAEEYTRAAGSHPAERVTLTSKGLAAMNAVPAGLKQSIGAALTKATEQGSQSNHSAIGDLIGVLLGGFTKSMSSG